MVKEYPYPHTPHRSHTGSTPIEPGSVKANLNPVIKTDPTMSCPQVEGFHDTELNGYPFKHEAPLHWLARSGSNRRSLAYQAIALPLSYEPMFAIKSDTT